MPKLNAGVLVLLEKMAGDIDCGRVVWGGEFIGVMNPAILPEEIAPISDQGVPHERSS